MTTELNKLKSEIADLTDKSAVLQEQINAAKCAAEKSAQVSSDADALRQQRHRLLAQIHLGRANDSMLTVIDKQLATAEAAERRANQSRQGAEGASDLLSEELAAIQRPLAALHAQLPAVLYRAHCEHAAEAIEPFRDALAGLATAHAVLQGRQLAVDKFADPRNGRLFLSTGLVSSFTTTLPAIPNHVEGAELSFDMKRDIELEFEEALALFGCAAAAQENQRQRIEAAADEADRAMRVAMAAVGAA